VVVIAAATVWCVHGLEAIKRNRDEAEYGVADRIAFGDTIDHHLSFIIGADYNVINMRKIIIAKSPSYSACTKIPGCYP
jgi:hypothetical protein